jgi:hypothetical protein
LISNKQTSAIRQLRFTSIEFEFGKQATALKKDYHPANYHEWIPYGIRSLDAVCLETCAALGEVDDVESSCEDNFGQESFDNRCVDRTAELNPSPYGDSGICPQVQDGLRHVPQQLA